MRLRSAPTSAAHPLHLVRPPLLQLAVGCRQAGRPPLRVPGTGLQLAAQQAMQRLKLEELLAAGCQLGLQRLRVKASG